MAYSVGEVDKQGMVYLGECLTLSRNIGANRWAAKTLHDLGVFARNGPDLDKAKSFCEESLALFEADGDIVEAGTVRRQLAEIMAHQGDYAQATAILEELLAFFRKTNSKGDIAQSLHTLAFSIMKQGDIARAKMMLKEAFAIYRELSQGWGTWICLEISADLAKTEGRIERAVRLFGAAAFWIEAAWGVKGKWLIDYDNILASTRTRLGEKKFDAEWNEGSTMSWEEAEKYALADED